MSLSERVKRYVFNDALKDSKLKLVVICNGRLLKSLGPITLKLLSPYLEEVEGTINFKL